MRVSSDTDELRMAPGGGSAVVLEILNTGTVIDGVRARALGLPDHVVTSEPSSLSLFPDARGSLSLRFDLPRDFPAGRHPLVLEVAGTADAAEHLDLDLVVEPHPALALEVHPSVARGRRRVRYAVQVANRGNMPLTVALSVSDTEAALQCVATPATLAVAAGTSATALLEVRGPRRLTGGELDRPVALTATAVDLDLEPDADPVTESVALVFRQRPLLGRGLLTALVLASIITLWALAFLFGIRGVLGKDPLTKTAPASFFVGTPVAADGTPVPAATAGAAPAGAAPKTGILPPGVGGVLSGRVVAASDASPVSRVVVTAWRRAGTTVVAVASAATQTDGTYSVAGLFPGRYLLTFCATGYLPDPCPPSTLGSGLATATAAPATTTTVKDVVITGKPASLQGTVDFGDVLTAATAKVSVASLSAAGATTAVGTATTDAKGAYVVSGLPAPGHYQVTITAPGYLPSTYTVQIAGGQDRFAPAVLLSAGDSSISGVVTDQQTHAPLGGVTVTTTEAGQTVTLGTPTIGSVGTYTLTGLRTPQTYVITFSKPGYAPYTTVQDLKAGQAAVTLPIALVGGTDIVQGRVVTAGSGGGTVGVGGATVTVGGTAAPVTTTTVTAGPGVSPSGVGAFQITGLPTPGTYTLTVTAPGMAPQTVPVTLTAEAAAASLTITLGDATGALTGSVSVPVGTSVAGVTVTVTNGLNPTVTQTDSTGSFTVADLPPGTYAVTASGTGLTQRTAIVTVVAGSTATVKLALVAAP